MQRVQSLEPAQPTYALVTGASRGLGKTFAETLAARKQNVVLVARSRDKLEIFTRDLQAAHGILAEALECDLARPGAGQGLARQLLDRQLRIHLLVNNAGFGARGRFWELPLDRQLEMIRLNNEAIVQLTFHLLPSMMERAQVGIINVSSTAGFQPIPYAALYAATKSFLTSFSLGLEQELRPYGLRVVTVCPGRIRARSQADGATKVERDFSAIYQTPEEVVRDTLKVLDRGGGLVVPGFANKIALFAERFIPRRAIPKLVAKMSRP
jgi:short-subunit dehydrogenase